MSCLIRTFVKSLVWSYFLAILEIAGLTTVKVDFDGLHNSAVCSSKPMAHFKCLEDDIGSVISSPMFAVEINVGDESTHLLFSA